MITWKFVAFSSAHQAQIGALYMLRFSINFWVLIYQNVLFCEKVNDIQEPLDPGWEVTFGMLSPGMGAT